MKYKIFAGTCLVLIGIFAATGLYYKNQQGKMYDSMARENASTFVREHSQTLGSDEAKVTIVEFMDPACETCAAFSPMIKDMVKSNPGRIKLVLRYAPFHEGADYFVKLLEASRKQGKYWETLEVMFNTQQIWAPHHVAKPEKIWPLLAQTGLDLDRIKSDMNDPAIEALIKQDLADADALNVRKTPGFFVNGKPLEPFGRQQLIQLVKSEFESQY